MADDGNGYAIYIPSLIIKQSDGNAIKNHLAAGDAVNVLLRPADKKQDAIEWSLWTSAFDTNSVQLKSTLGSVWSELETKTIFTPHYFFLDGSQYGCEGTFGTACGSQCTNYGQYCAVDPEHDLDTGISGADIVRENVRQICIWRMVNSTNERSKWWDYVNCFQRTCITASNATQECSEVCQSVVNVSHVLVSQCVDASGGTGAYGGRNTLIEAENSARQAAGTYLLPTLYVDHTLFQGSMNCPAPVFRGTCQPLGYICSSLGNESSLSLCSNTPPATTAPPAPTPVPTNETITLPPTPPSPYSLADVHVRFWTSSYDDKSVSLKSSFGSVYHAIGNTTWFYPHYFFLEGSQLGCISGSCNHMCTNNGRYCAYDPDQDTENGVSGEDVVRENLRQICIWRTANSTFVHHPWWNYVNCFQKSCVEGNSFFFNCSERCMKESGVNASDVMQCVAESGGYAHNDSANSIISSELSLKRHDMVMFPALLINKKQYVGSLSCPYPVTQENCGLFKAICETYKHENKSAPAVCSSKVPICPQTGPCGPGTSTGTGSQNGTASGTGTGPVVVGTGSGNTENSTVTTSNSTVGAVAGVSLIVIFGLSIAVFFYRRKATGGVVVIGSPTLKYARFEGQTDHNVDATELE
eukprot:TRINITY_DN15163_c0_g1_i1.p1 TRINITY_DN15163_c0_g1~~TRINITY_DN15163_c0_g1_i1.p1  ORF type:complete len:719 (-),score=152.00 TRINITY_DN15163_c0_g1_i1:1435-3354(-)